MKTAVKFNGKLNCDERKFQFCYIRKEKRIFLSRKEKLFVREWTSEKNEITAVQWKRISNEPRQLVWAEKVKGTSSAALERLSSARRVSIDRRDWGQWYFIVCGYANYSQTFACYVTPLFGYSSVDEVIKLSNVAVWMRCHFLWFRELESSCVRDGMWFTLSGDYELFDWMIEMTQSSSLITCASNSKQIAAYQQPNRFYFLRRFIIAREQLTFVVWLSGVSRRCALIWFASSW